MKFKDTLQVLEHMVDLMIKQKKPLNDVVLLLLKELRNQVDEFAMSTAEEIGKAFEHVEERDNRLADMERNLADLQAKVLEKETEISALKGELDVYRMLGTVEEAEGLIEQNIDLSVAVNEYSMDNQKTVLLTGRGR